MDTKEHIVSDTDECWCDPETVTVDDPEAARLRAALRHVRDYPNGWEGTNLSVRDYIDAILSEGP